MAAKLQCEICGGKLVGKPGGVFECEYCGTEYSTEWCRSKIQEIQGTVRVEGPVTVTGKLSVEGTATEKSLLKRGFLLLEDGNCEEAREYFDRVLDVNPENGNAYLGRLLSCFGVRNCSELARIIEQPLGISDYQRAVRYGDESLRETLRNTVLEARRRFRQEFERVKAIDDAFYLSLAGKKTYDFIRCSGGVGPDVLDIQAAGHEDFQFILYEATAVCTTEPHSTIYTMLPSLEAAITRSGVITLILARDWNDEFIETLAVNAKNKVFYSIAVSGLSEEELQRYSAWAGAELETSGHLPNIFLSKFMIDRDGILLCKN